MRLPHRAGFASDAPVGEGESRRAFYPFNVLPIASQCGIF